MFSLMNLAAISLIPFYIKSRSFFNTCKCTNWLDSSPWEWSYWKLFIQWVQSHYLVCKSFLRETCGHYLFTRLSWIVWWLFSTKVYNLCFHSCSLQYKELMHKPGTNFYHGKKRILIVELNELSPGLIRQKHIAPSWGFHSTWQITKLFIVLGLYLQASMFHFN